VSGAGTIKLRLWRSLSVGDQRRQQQRALARAVAVSASRAADGRAAWRARISFSREACVRDQAIPAGLRITTVRAPTHDRAMRCRYDACGLGRSRAVTRHAARFLRSPRTVRRQLTGKINLRPGASRDGSSTGLIVETIDASTAVRDRTGAAGHARRCLERPVSRSIRPGRMRRGGTIDNVFRRNLMYVTCPVRRHGDPDERNP
jgi:hypothetical protein